MEITKEKFDAYRKVQYSGITNMFMLPRVMALSGLTREECLEIMKSYSQLKEKYGEYKIERRTVYRRARSSDTYK